MNIRLMIQRLFSTVITVAILAMAIFFLFISILIGGFYAVYQFMLSQGINTVPASLATIIFSATLLCIIVILVKKYMDRLSRPKGHETIIEGFFKGLRMGNKPRI